MSRPRRLRTFGWPASARRGRAARPAPARRPGAHRRDRHVGHRHRRAVVRQAQRGQGRLRFDEFRDFRVRIIRDGAVLYDQPVGDPCDQFCTPAESALTARARRPARPGRRRRARGDRRPVHRRHELLRARVRLRLRRRREQLPPRPASTPAADSWRATTARDGVIELRRRRLPLSRPVHLRRLRLRVRSASGATGSRASRSSRATFPVEDPLARPADAAPLRARAPPQRRAAFVKGALTPVSSPTSACSTAAAPASASCALAIRRGELDRRSPFDVSPLGPRVPARPEALPAPHRLPGLGRESPPRRSSTLRTLSSSVWPGRSRRSSQLEHGVDALHALVERDRVQLAHDREDVLGGRPRGRCPSRASGSAPAPACAGGAGSPRCTRSRSRPGGRARGLSGRRWPSVAKATPERAARRRRAARRGSAPRGAPPRARRARASTWSRPIASLQATGPRGCERPSVSPVSTSSGEPTPSPIANAASFTSWQTMPAEHEARGVLDPLGQQAERREEALGRLAGERLGGGQARELHELRLRRAAAAGGSRRRRARRARRGCWRRRAPPAVRRRAARGARRRPRRRPAPPGRPRAARSRRRGRARAGRRRAGRRRAGRAPCRRRRRAPADRGPRAGRAALRVVVVAAPALPAEPPGRDHARLDRARAPARLAERELVERLAPPRSPRRCPPGPSARTAPCGSRRRAGRSGRSARAWRPAPPAAAAPRR